eukprot:GHVN01071670.1.p1 GENE.GHVN01071670.1~~GHVN01071670.1.p1  ORF type:complete len:602 (+),score=76.04 GHVN01071670.1:530-2335(+)
MPSSQHAFHLTHFLCTSADGLIGVPPPPPPDEPLVKADIKPQVPIPDAGGEERQVPRAQANSPVIYPGSHANAMHGRLGLDSSGLPLWQTKPPPPADLNMQQALAQGGGFNLFLSDHLPLSREVPDTRDPQCKAIHYDLNDLPTASVVIVFYNEPMSTLLRSVHSVLDRTPPQLLDEIILVDDGSTVEWIRSGGSDELVNYVNALPKARMVRNVVRKGIVAARLHGIKEVKSDIFAILDSHIEVQPEWLEPLVKRLKDHPMTVLMPQIDGITSETMVHNRGGIGCTLGFLWKLMEHSFDTHDSPMPERRNAGPSDFVSSPTMAGGLFAANKQAFMDLGSYDEQFAFWGTENLELSFRIWQCGGRLECAPCSRVYHIFRKGGIGYSSPGNSVTKNKMRTLAVWMDEYADLAWRVLRRPKIDIGSLEERRLFRESHQCKPFSWFLSEVNPESTVKKIPEDVPHLGPVVNQATSKCLDARRDAPGGTPGLNRCHGGDSQEFMYFAKVNHIMPVTNDEACLSPQSVNFEWCHKGQTRWEYTGGQIRELGRSKCLSAVGESGDGLQVASCDVTDPKQIWNWSSYNPPAVFGVPVDDHGRLRGVKGE